MTQEEIQKLRGLPIEEVALRLGMSVSRHKATCPFHPDKHPSLVFCQKFNDCKCYSCGAKADSIGLTMHVLGKGFVDACRWLADNNNVILSDERSQRARVVDTERQQVDLPHLERLIANPHLTAEAQHWLYDERRIDPRVVQWLGLTSITESVPMSSRRHSSRFNGPALLIPYRDVEGRLLTVQARYLGAREGVEKPKPRFQFPYGSPICIFNLPVLALLRPRESLYVCEGPSDTMAMLSSGHKAIAIPSATSLLPVHRQQLAEVVKRLGGLQLHLYPDHDAAGEKFCAALTTMANEIGACLVRHNLPAGAKDYGEAWSKGLL